MRLNSTTSFCFLSPNLRTRHLAASHPSRGGRRLQGVPALDRRRRDQANAKESRPSERLNDTANAEALIKQFQTNFEADGVEGTPTLFINGTKHGNMAYADLKAIIDAELAK